MAQKGQTQILKVKALKNSDKALDQSALESLALRYVSRYATTKHKLASYLHRKVREKNGDADQTDAITEITNKYERLGYIDDALFAQNKASALQRKGYGERRIAQALNNAGISEPDQKKALLLSEQSKWDAAEKFARKRRIGPFAPEEYDRAKCQKLLQAFMRAGHGYDIAIRFVFAKPGEMVSLDT